MTTNRAIKLAYSQRRLNGALSRFLRQMPEARETVLRKIGFDVLRDTVVSITTGEGGNPKRVDTGRYRAAWRAGGEDVGIDVPGPSTASAQPRDGQGRWIKRRNETALEVTNNVEYGAFVEYGTEKMAPGNHLTRAMELARRNVPRPKGPAQEELQFRWGNS